MKIEEVKRLSAKQRFLYWIRERDQILKRRKADKPKPWTDDEILQSYYFTNVRREDDKVTQWFSKNVRDPLRKDPAVVFATIAFRWFNWPDTGEVLHQHGLLTSWNTQMAVGILTDRKNRGLQVFTGAFNISNSGSTKDKVSRVCEDYIQPVWEEREHLYKRLNGASMASAFKDIQLYPGLGGSGFMAAQVVCDLAFTHILEKAVDWWTWCSWGPGSKRGMNRVFGFGEDCPMPRKDWDVRLKALTSEIGQALGLQLHARDVQSCLCEFGKYERALWGIGHLKRRYNGLQK